MDIGIIGGSYINKYTSTNPQRTINWYIHKSLIQGEDDKYQETLQPTPGLTSYTSTNYTTGRGIFRAITLNYDRCFTVIDNHLIEINSNGTTTDQGVMSSLAINGSKCFMACNQGDQLMIANASASYIFSLANNTLTQITDSNFPGGVVSLTQLQGLFIIVTGPTAASNTPGRIYYSNLNDGTTWNPLNVFTTSATPSGAKAAIVWRDDLYIFTSESIETYIFDGTDPFIKQGRDTIFVGLVAIESLCVFHDGIIFLGRTAHGQSTIYYYNGQTVTPISTAGVSWALNNPTTLAGLTWDKLSTFVWNVWVDPWGVALSDSYAEVQYSKDQHVFYNLTIPAIHTTYVFDIISKEWTERHSFNTTNGLDLEFRGKYMTNWNGMNLYTDIYSGNILQEDYTNQTELGNTITRTRISKVVSNQKQNISIYEVEFDINSGIGITGNPTVSPNIKFYYSRDGGNTYSTEIDIPIGAAGSYGTRARTHKLGTSRDWAFKLVVTDAADLTIQAAIAHGVVDSY